MIDKRNWVFDTNSNPYIFVTSCCKPEIFQIMTSVRWSNNLGYTLLGSKVKGIIILSLCGNTLIVFIFVNSKSQNSEMFSRTYLSWLISVSLTSTSASRSILSSTGSRTVLLIYIYIFIDPSFQVLVQEQFFGYI